MIESGNLKNPPDRGTANEGGNKLTILKEVNDTIYKIIGSCMEVHRILGPGLAVDFYRKALAIEFAEKGITFEIQKSLDVNYKGNAIGSLEIDFLTADGVIVSLRSQEDLKDIEIQQVLRCLPLAKSSIGLLVNFGNTKIQYKRILPSRASRGEVRKDFRQAGMREIGRTREGNPIL